MPKTSPARELERNPDIAALETMYERSVITRRDFTSRLLALGVTAALAGELVSSIRPVRAATPKRGGRMRAAMGQHGPDDTLDPALFTNSTDYCRGEQFYNGLTRLDGSLEPQPELAESWEAKPGAAEWVFKLRNGVEFHNGKPLEATDVVYSIMRHLDENVGSAAKGFFEELDSVTAEDKHTVRFKLKGPNADFPVVLGLYHMKILPEGYNDFSTAVGTGPFIVKEFKPGVRSLAVRNPDYFEEGKPYLDEIEWFAITDSLARLNALLAGDILMMADLDPKAIARVEQADGIEVVSTKAGTYVNFAAMCDREPTSNPDLRLALKYLQDRERMVKVIYKGYGSPANDHPISPMDPFYCDEIPQRQLDLDRAKHHFTKSGLGNTTLPVHTSEAPGAGAIEIALMLQQNAAKIGMDIEVKRDPTDGYWSATWMQKPFYMSGWNMRPTTNIMLTLGFRSDAAWNEAAWKNTRVDEVIAQGRAELDKAKRKTLYCEAQRLIHEDGGWIIPVFVDYLDAMSSQVKGFQPVPLGPLGAMQWPKFVWLES